MNPPASHVSCPNCADGRGEFLTGVSAQARVWYYRCADCAQVWSVPKPEPSQPPMPDPQSARSSDDRGAAS